MDEKKTKSGPSGASGNSRDRAASLGTTVKTKIERGDRYSAPEIYNLEITVLEVVRGKEAWDRIRAEGTFQDDFKAGFEPCLIRIKFGYFKKGRGFGHNKSPYEIPDDAFRALSQDGETEYPIPSSPEQPRPRLSKTPFISGDIKEGWILLQVPEGEERPLLTFKRDYRENAYGFWGPVWFQLWT
ncbi:MAG: hypothetical protein AMJ94_14735 [Deltaproteobacteria bacterium SM23_61]|nr:MAG: hypothetical protein AMJ94_14735 [Deltaproteobacteria bacterium SM23_61]